MANLCVLSRELSPQFDVVGSAHRRKLRESAEIYTADRKMGIYSHVFRAVLLLHPPAEAARPLWIWARILKIYGARRIWVRSIVDIADAIADGCTQMASPRVRRIRKAAMADSPTGEKYLNYEK